MSGIYIPNMVNPVRCSECDFCTFGYCGLLDRYVTDSAYKDDACPLVPVPTPHGRLKDADALYAVIKKERDRIAKDYGDDDPFVQCLTKYAMSMVLSAPTIIEAEEGDDGAQD